MTAGILCEYGGKTERQLAMKIQNALVYTEDGTFAQLDVMVKEGQIRAVTPKGGLDRETDEIAVDGTGMYLIPGLTDIHFHGCAGYDLCDGTGEALEAMARYEARNGITTICPAVMACPEETLTQVCRSARTYGSKKGAVLAGIRLEGPFLSEEKTGALNPGYLRKPDVDLYRRLQEAAGGRIRLVDIAPEAEGAMDFIQALRGEAVCSLAHTTADYDIAMRAFYAGASQVTHLYNAMEPYTHRNPGLIGAAADTPGCLVELIGDGIHVHPAVVRSTLRMFGPDRVIFISDSIRATGLEDGQYSLGGRPVDVRGRRAAFDDGTIAGSVTNLMQTVQRVVNEMGIPLETAVRCAAVNPAKSIGIFDRYGSIAPGKAANLVLLDQELNVMTVILNGEEYRD